MTILSTLADGRTHKGEAYSEHFEVCLEDGFKYRNDDAVVR